MSSADLRQSLAPVLEHAGYETDTHMDWFGQHVDYNPTFVRFGRAGPGYPVIVAQLAQFIYDRFYTRGRIISDLVWERRRPAAHRALPGGISSDKTLDRAFIQALHQANQSLGILQPGFRAVETKGTMITVANEAGQTMMIPVERFESVDGKVGSVRLDKGSSTTQQGWYYAFGDSTYQVELSKTVRVYWHVTRLGVFPLLRSLTAGLNAAKVPFRFKAPASPSQYTRADAGVLYLPEDAWHLAAPVVGAVHDQVRPWMREVPPAFTRPLGHGLGLAEDPGNGESFGSHRARLVAEALWDAHVAGIKGADQKFDLVLQRISKEGLNPAAVHLRSVHSDPYELVTPPAAAGVTMAEVEA